MVVPRLMSQALRNEPLTIFGDGSQKRCFCDISDVVEALLVLIDHPSVSGSVYNVGNPNEEVSILDLGMRIREITHSSSELTFVPYAKAYAPGFEDMQRRVPNISRIQSVSGWRPNTPLDVSLMRVQQSLMALPNGSLPEVSPPLATGDTSAHVTTE